MTMTEEAIERLAERLMDGLDFQLMNDPTFSQADYDEQVAAMNREIEALYARNRR